MVKTVVQGRFLSSQGFASLATWLNEQMESSLGMFWGLDVCAVVSRTTEKCYWELNVQSALCFYSAQLMVHFLLQDFYLSCICV